MKTRTEAFSLLREYTQSDSLIKHALAVESAMRFYAQRVAEQVELWGITGLLHDFDYERFPNLDGSGHPVVGSQILREQGYPEALIEAILGHAHFTGVERRSALAKTLFACDELCGLVTAAALVRPDRSIHNLEMNSVKKKMKDKAFARGVNRDDILIGALEIGVPLEEHITNVILAMRGAAAELGLSGR